MGDDGHMRDDDVLVMETDNREKAFALYDHVCKGSRIAWAKPDLRVAGKMMYLYAVCDVPVKDLQPGPLATYKEELQRLKTFAEGFNVGWTARK